MNEPKKWMQETPSKKMWKLQCALCNLYFCSTPKSFTDATTEAITGKAQRSAEAAVSEGVS
uniref:Uncharacterized protein n=1 Tax=Setaria digitata TaxID=48799 RepID=A0A915PZW8_9BILA